MDLPAESVGENLMHQSYLSLLSGQGPFVLVLGGNLVFVLILGMVSLERILD